MTCARSRRSPTTATCCPADSIIASGPPATVAGSSSREDVRQFMHGLPDGPVPFHYPAPDYAEQIRQVR